MNRRQGKGANAGDRGMLEEIAAEARSASMPAALALNSAYTRDQHPALLEAARLWAEGGGSALIVSDPAFLLRLRSDGPGLPIRLSILAEVLNSESAAFFRDLGVARIVLPRSLSVPEMAALTARSPAGLEFEAMALNDACLFMDGLCGFYHGKSFPDGCATSFECERTGPGLPAAAYASDLRYGGHGCALPFRCASGSIVPPAEDDARSPPCAACSLSALREAGVRYLKLGGRGMDTAGKLRSTAFVSQVLGTWAMGLSEEESKERIRDLYARSFLRPCGGARCYYPVRAGKGA
jgi:collagenase-like PrtC family protease